MLYYAPLMARKSREDAEETRRRILARALALFVRKGYEHTTFNDIAAQLKMTKGAVYWHFESKEELLVELVKMALERFRQQIETAMPEGELTFPAVAEMMVRNAVEISGAPREAAFYRLLKSPIAWSTDRMSSVRKQLLEGAEGSPKAAFREALRNDMKRGRCRKVDEEEFSTVAMALWGGLVEAKIDGLLGCDLAQTLTNSYKAIWNDIKRRNENE